MIRRSRFSMLAVAALLFSACGGGESGDASSDTGLDAPDRTLAVTPEPLYTVGGFDAPDWATFGGVSRVAFDENGHLYILDSQTDIVTEVDGQGRFVRTIGRKGEGPGELSSPMTFAVADDGGVAVFDIGHQGWVVYGADGTYQRNVRVDLAETGIPGDVSPYPTGGVVGPVAGRMSFGGGGDADDEAHAPSRPIVYFALADDDSSRVVYDAWDLPAPPEGDQQRIEMSGGGSLQLRMPVLRAFEPGIDVSVLPDGRIAVVDSVGYRIKIIDLSGAVVDVLERPIVPTEVTAGIQDREKQRRLDELLAQEGGGTRMMVTVRGGSGGGTVDQQGVRRMQEGRLESMIFADEIPVIEQMATDREGRIWVQRSSGEPGEDGPTDLLTVDGRYLGTIPADGLRIPAAFGPGGLMVRIEEDDFDVPTLVVERMPADIG